MIHNSAPHSISQFGRKGRQINSLICVKVRITIIALILTYLNVNDCVVVHPHRKHRVWENHSDLIQQLLLQRSTVELLWV